MNLPAQVICVTPVRDEAWILDPFLRGASIWADHVVVADQGSTDGSAEIARRFPKVRLIDNPAESYDEAERQRLLLDAARRYEGRRLIVALDADEALSLNGVRSEEWEQLRRADEGTVACFEWVHPEPDLESCWIPPPRWRAFAFVDDGSAHSGDRIHNPRLPFPPDTARVEMQETRILHFQFFNRGRMKSKQRWYQCWERLNYPAKRPTQIYRQYHRVDALPQVEIHPFDRQLIRGYEAEGIDFTKAQEHGVLRWDQEVVQWMAEHGSEVFRRLSIWDVDWAQVADEAGLSVEPKLVRDPRTPPERAVHRWLERTQPRAHAPAVRVAQRALIPFGW